MLKKLRYVRYVTPIDFPRFLLGLCIVITNDTFVTCSISGKRLNKCEYNVADKEACQLCLPNIDLTSDNY